MQILSEMTRQGRPVRDIERKVMMDMNRKEKMLHSLKKWNISLT